MGERPAIPEPDRQATLLWLQKLTLAYLHETGWEEVNRRLHTIAYGTRVFANNNYTPEESKEKAAFFDGATFSMLALLHSVDIQQLQQLFEAESAENFEDKSTTAE